MALLWIDGFEQYDTNTELFRVYGTNIPNAATSIQTGRNTLAGENRSVEVDNVSLYIWKNFPKTDNFVMGFAYNCLTVLADSDIMQVYSPNYTEMITLRMSLAGELFLDRGTVNLASTSGLGLVPTTWYYIEFSAVIHDTTGTYDVWVDGINVITGTGADTRNGTDTEVNLVELQGHAGDPNWDDFYILDDSGSDNISRLGDVRVETVFPDANGTTNNFTASPAVSNYLNVDDGLTPDDDTTYNHSATAADKELYGFGALAGAVGTVYAVGLTVLARKEESGERTLRHVARSNVTEVESADFAVGVSYQHRQHIYENDPNGGIDWTETSVNAAEFGMKIQA